MLRDKVLRCSGCNVVYLKDTKMIVNSAHVNKVIVAEVRGKCFICENPMHEEITKVKTVRRNGMRS